MWFHKITSSLLTSFWLCLRRPSMRNSWVSVSLRRWRWSLFILTGLSAVLYFSFSSPLSLSRVLAADILPQTTATWVPLFVSPTPAPTQDMTCSGEQPAGWGAVTPDMTWYLNCSNCITPDGLETSTPAVIGTPPPAGTGTPAVTITPTPSFYLICGTGNIGGTCSEVALGVIGGSFQYLDDTSQPYNSGGAQAHLHIQGSPNLPANTVLYVTFYSATWTVNSFYGVDRLVDTYLSAGGGYQVDDDLLLSEYGSVSSSLPAPYYYQATTGLSNIYTGVTFWAYANRSGSLGSYSGSGTFEVYVSTDGYYTPEVPSTSYCGEVVPAGGEDPCEIGAFCLPSPGTGATSCPVDIPSVTIPLGVLGFDDIVIPYFRICFTEIHFGSMIVWGILIDLDYIAYIIAAAAVVKILTRS